MVRVAPGADADREAKSPEEPIEEADEEAGGRREELYSIVLSFERLAERCLRDVRLLQCVSGMSDQKRIKYVGYR